MKLNPPQKTLAHNLKSLCMNYLGIIVGASRFRLVTILPLGSYLFSNTL